MRRVRKLGRWVFVLLLERGIGTVSRLRLYSLANWRNTRRRYQILFEADLGWMSWIFEMRCQCLNRRNRRRLDCHSCYEASTPLTPGLALSIFAMKHSALSLADFHSLLGLRYTPAELNPRKSARIFSLGPLNNYAVHKYKTVDGFFSNSF